MTLLDFFLLGGLVSLFISNMKLRSENASQQRLLTMQDSAVLEAIAKVQAAAEEVELAHATVKTEYHDELTRIRIRCSGCDFDEVVMNSSHDRAVEQARLISQAHDEMHFPQGTRYLN